MNSAAAVPLASGRTRPGKTFDPVVGRPASSAAAAARICVRACSNLTLQQLKHERGHALAVRLDRLDDAKAAVDADRIFRLDQAVALLDADHVVAAHISDGLVGGLVGVFEVRQQRLLATPRVYRDGQSPGRRIEDGLAERFGEDVGEPAEDAHDALTL